MRAISYPFKITPSGKISTTSNMSKIYQDRVLTLVSTLIRQRFMRASYGVDLGRGMFENANDYTSGLDSAIRNAMAVWIPELTFLDLFIGNVDEDGVVAVDLSLALPNNTSIELSFKTVTISPDGTATYLGS